MQQPSQLLEIISEFENLFHSVFWQDFIFIFEKVARWKKRLCVTYSKIWIFPPRTESQAFVLVFVRKKNEFLTAKHWLSWLSVTQKLRRTVLKKVNTDWQEKRIQILLYVYYPYRRYSQQLTFKHFFKTKEHEKMNDPSETISTHCAHKIISGVQKKRRKKKLRTIIISAFWELLRSYVQSALLGPFPDMKVWIVPCSVIKKTRYFNFLLGAVNFGFEMREDFTV